MGYMRHNAIIVTAPLSEKMIEAHSIVRDIADKHGRFCDVTSLTQETTNGYVSFLVAPDGSKEGWEASDSGDRTRDDVIEYLNSLRHGDGSTSFKFVEVQFGDDNKETKVLRHSDQKI